MMKVVILAGGYGTRLSEETEIKPKPMVEIGGHPIIWHIMKHYSSHGHNEFIILLGYKGYVIKEYFLNYFAHNSDITIDLQDNKIDFHSTKSEPWKISLVDTGLDSLTAKRIKLAQPFLNNENFLMTYGDGLSDVNIQSSINFHDHSGAVVTMTTVQPSGRYGAVDIKDSIVERFVEKPQGDGSWINGGFFICDNKIFDFITDKNEMFESGPMERMASAKAISAFKHQGFWQCMDTLRDKHALEELWGSECPPWKSW
jgi:glucose-1-phosphate cytidylyltransferase